MSFQDTIDKQLKTVQENGEIITSDEFALICEADYYRPAGEKWYSKHRSLVSGPAKIGASVASAVTLGLYGKFRKATDRCNQNCKTITGARKQKCKAICNMNAAKQVVSNIKSNSSALNKIKDPEKKRKAQEVVAKELIKWQDRYDKYKQQVASLSSTVAQMDMKRKKKRKK